MTTEKIELEVIIPGQQAKTVVYAPGKGKKTLKELLQSAGIYPETPCGGKGICGKCIVLMDGKPVRACSAVPEKNCRIELSRRNASVLLDAPQLPAAPLKEGLGLALDLGTTTVAAFLYDLKTGTCLAMKGALNAQHIFGADVISRIRYAENDRKLLQETAVIREQVFDLILELCRAAGESTGKTYLFSDIHYVSIAGNTVMQHIYAAISPASIGTAPFKPVSLFGEQILAEPTMYFCPCVSGYVGGDTTAGILSTGIYGAEETVLFADLGTNCEFALGNREGFLCCSAPAGPAFETVSENGKLWGSELIDRTAELLADGKIDETGRLLAEEQEAGLGRADVRNLQLAKASVRGAIETLLELAGTGADCVDRIVLAGGFGKYLNPETVCAIGMFPEKFEGKIEFAGNSAGRGACLALTEENRHKLSRIARMCRYEELSSSAVFTGHYIDSMGF